MKVAVCISGQPRTWRNTVSWLRKNLIEPFSADVFLHSWCSYDSNEYKDIIEAYSPIRHVIDLDNCLNVLNYERGTKGWSTYGIVSMYRSIWLSNNLRVGYESEQNMTYDWVFRVRFDCRLEYFFDLTRMSNKYLYVPSKHGLEHPWNQNQPFPRIVCDTMAFSNSHNMSIYSNVYPNIDRYYNQGSEIDCDGCFEKTVINGEHLLAMQLNQFQMRQKISFVPVNPIIRPG